MTPQLSEMDAYDIAASLLSELEAERRLTAALKATVSELQQALRQVSASYLDELRDMAREAAAS